MWCGGLQVMVKEMSAKLCLYIYFFIINMLDYCMKHAIRKICNVGVFKIKPLFGILLKVTSFLNSFVLSKKTIINMKVCLSKIVSIRRKLYFKNIFTTCSSYYIVLYIHTFKIFVKCKWCLNTKISNIRI